MGGLLKVRVLAMLIFAVKGQDQPEFASAAGCAVEFDPAGQAVRGSGGDGEAEAQSAGGAVAGVVDSVEAFEDALLMFRGDPDAVVADCESELLAVFA